MPKTILVIDDDLQTTTMIEFALTAAGYQVIAALNGEDGLGIIKTDQEIDLILCDIHMQQTNSLTFLKTAIIKRPYTPVLLMISHQTPEILTETFELGAFGAIYKPFESDDIVSIIDKLFTLIAEKQQSLRADK